MGLVVRAPVWCSRIEETESRKDGTKRVEPVMEIRAALHNCFLEVPLLASPCFDDSFCDIPDPSNLTGTIATTYGDTSRIPPAQPPRKSQFLTHLQQSSRSPRVRRWNRPESALNDLPGWVEMCSSLNFL